MPGNLAASESFDVLAGTPPQITDGYAMLTTVSRPGRTGLSVFQGYNPIAMTVGVRWDSYRDASTSPAENERDIALLERMAGRGNFAGAATGPPPVIRVSTTDANGAVVPVIPSNYQWSKQNPSAPVWRIGGIDWDPDPLRDGQGRRIRQLATVTLIQKTAIKLATRSVARRAKAKR